MKISFNTGRLYTELGQVITVLVLNHNGQNHTMFMDHSRGIGGIIEGTPTPLNVDVIVEWVMHHYDRNNYQPSFDAMNLDRLDTIHKVRI